MASRGRYLKPTEFGRLLADLRITSNMFQDRFLEWLEQERIVVPVARIRWPESMVLEGREIEGAPQPTDEERNSTEVLRRTLRLWNRSGADPELDHPLDLPEPPCPRLVDKTVGHRPFEPWDSMRTNIAPPGASPLYVLDGVETFYHDWQALLTADAIEMGVRIVFDTRDPERQLSAVNGDLVKLTELRRYHLMSFDAPRGLKAGLRWAPLLDAAARVEVVRDRKISAIWSAHGYEPFILDGAERDDFNALSKREAAARVADIDASLDDLIAFIGYLCDRWDEWSRRGRVELAGEYARHLRRTLRLVKDAFDLTHEQLETEISTIIEEGPARLASILPDWTKEARAQLELSLRHAVLPKALSAGPELAPDEADLTDLLDWTSGHSWKIHLAVDEIIKHQSGTSPESSDAHARAVESLTTAFEHLIGDLLGEAGISPTGTLMPKLLQLWSADPDVSRALKLHSGLTRTSSVPRIDQLARIAALPAADAKIGVVQMLLRTVLYRNDGLHNSMSGWLEVELGDAAIAVLTALLFCRKQVLVNPPKP